MITIYGQVATAKGLRERDRKLVYELVKTWAAHTPRNLLRHTYYSMKNVLKDLGISVPPRLRKLDAACGWGAKCVDVMVDHLKFDGYTADDVEAQEFLRRVVRRSDLESLYNMATTSALEQCFSLYFVYKDKAGNPRVSAYPASVCGCTWNDAENRLDAVMFVVSTKKGTFGERTPDWVNVVTDEYVIRIRLDDAGAWHAEYLPHGLEHLPVFISRHKPSLMRPFGTSRITREVMGYIDSAVRENINEEIASAFASSAQKYLLGTDGDPFEDVSRWSAYIGAIFNIDATEDGIVPQFGQLPQPSMQPLSDHWRILCGKMSGATGIHVSQFGQVHDQPASGDAIYQENEPLILKCNDWNRGAKSTLVDVATALVATERGTTFDAIDSEGLGIVANLPNPAMPTLAQQTDASVKIASVVPGFASTRQFWIMNGFSVEEADRTMAEVEAAQTKTAAQAAVTAIFGGKDTSNAD